MLELKLVMRIVRRPSVFRLMFRFDVLATVNVLPGAMLYINVHKLYFLFLYLP